MLIVARNKLKFLQAGRELVMAHRNPLRYRTDRTYALGLDHRRQVCRVEILEVQAAGLRVRLARYHEPVYLLAARSQYGYVDNPAQAMRDEPEAIPPADLDRLARRAQARFQEQRAGELAAQQARSISIRLREAARRGDSAAYKALGAELRGLGGGDAS